MMSYTATRLLAVVGALSTLALMVYAARPWGNYAYQGVWGYAFLLFLAGWATLPYLLLVIMAKSAVPFASKEIFVFIGALIISVGGMAAYVDAVWLRPDPQGGLAFVAVPLYQLIVAGLLAGVQVLRKKSAVP
jgi:hypothetical protein